LTQIICSLIKLLCVMFLLLLTIWSFCM
jgi:hypothetical protein